MKTHLRLLVAILLVSAFAKAQDLKTSIDEYVSDIYTQDGTGISLLVAKDGKAIYKNAFGMANLELGVPMTTDNVFELASITKQFTAVSILMLEEQGKLKIADDITKYIPDYPTKGKTITIHNLLNHTSGIKSYTDMDSFFSKARTDMTVTELIDAFKNEPMDFDPGTEFHYNNSGYILLGYIIEQVSGETYEDFIENNLFKRLGMTNSRYGSKKELIKNRAVGYQPDENGMSNADYLSMTLPYAAGSLMSTVEDMLKWQNAIASNTIIKASTLEKAINGSKLLTGEEIDYGYGWGKAEVQGAKGYQHSGGIFGYSTNGIFLKEENVYVIGLSNCSCKNVGEVTQKVAAMAIGKPYPNYKKAITLADTELEKWVGAYQFEENVVRHITLKDGVLRSYREGSDRIEPFKIHPMTTSHFIFEDGIISYDFEIFDGKRQTTFSTPDGEFIGKGIDKAPPAEKKAITVEASVLKTYVGTYELAPTFKIEITSVENQLFAKATGQPQFELFAEDEDSFFLKVVPASVDFEKGDDGNVTGLILHQNGQDMPAKKIE